MQGSQIEDCDTAPRPIGKKELLLWASEASGMICSKFEDLRDGVIIVKLISSIWPRAVDPRNSRKMKASPQLDWELKRNWDTVKDIMTDIRLPVQLVDRAAIQQGRFRACYNLLVMLFFMTSLTKHREFSVDFAHPIDPRLSAFLQSNASIDALSRGGALSVHPSDTDEGEEGVRDSAAAPSRNYAAQVTPGPAHDRKSSSPSSTPLRSDLADFSNSRTSRSNSLEQPHSSSSHASTNLATPSSSSRLDPPPPSSSNPALRSTAASDRVHGSAPPHSAPPAIRSSLSNTIVFNALEQKIIDHVNHPPNLDVLWNDAVDHSPDGSMSFATVSAWLQQAFPVLRDIEATRLAFERVAEGSDLLATPYMKTDATLLRSNFADFLVHVLYYHRFILPLSHIVVLLDPEFPRPEFLLLANQRGFQLMSRPAQKSAKTSSQVQVSQIANMTAAFIVFCYRVSLQFVAAILGIPGGISAARDVFKVLNQRQSGHHSQVSPPKVRHVLCA
jgi:hypothetical protein